MSLLHDLKENILIADGAMGSILYSHGVDRSFDELNLTHPEQIQHVHEAYIHAGANVIQTNTYGANYIKLARYGLEEKVKEINQTAVKIAKEASQNNAYVLGNIGDRKSTRLNSSHVAISYSVFCLKNKSKT